MKRVFAVLFALCLTVSAAGTFFSTPSYAAKKATAAQESTTESSKDSEKNTAGKLPETGASYGIDVFDDGPDITAGSAILMDARSGAVLYAKNADSKRYPASITKVMTTLLAIENCKMDDMVTFSNQAVNGIEAGSSSAGIPVGAQLTMEETLYALMLVSANEAGAAIAEHISGSDEEFGKLMTERAKELGCTGTQFRNPHGLPDEEHYTTAHDMGLILQECIKHEEFRKISSTLNYTLEARDTLPSAIALSNHAKILKSDYPDYYYEYAVGAKTGFTHAALNTLVTFAEKDGVQLLCVILKDEGAPCSYYDTKSLYEWGFNKVKTINPLVNFNLNEALSSDESYDEDQVNTWLGLNPEYNPDFPLLVKKNFDMGTIKTSFRLKESTKKGILGYIDLKIDDETIYSTPVTYDKNSTAAKEYINKNGGGDDDLTTANKVTKGSLIKKAIGFLVRIAIAAILVFVIMQMIRRYQLEKQRQERMKKRRRKTGNSSSRENSSSKGNTSDKSKTSGRRTDRKTSTTNRKPKR